MWMILWRTWLQNGGILLCLRSMHPSRNFRALIQPDLSIPCSHFSCQTLQPQRLLVRVSSHFPPSLPPGVSSGPWPTIPSSSEIPVKRLSPQNVFISPGILVTSSQAAPQLSYFIPFNILNIVQCLVIIDVPCIFAVKRGRQNYEISQLC